LLSTSTQSGQTARKPSGCRPCLAPLHSNLGWPPLWSCCRPPAGRHKWPGSTWPRRNGACNRAKPFGNRLPRRPPSPVTSSWARTLTATVSLIFRKAHSPSSWSAIHRAPGNSRSRPKANPSAGAGRRRPDRLGWSSRVTSLARRCPAGGTWCRARPARFGSGNPGLANNLSFTSTPHAIDAGSKIGSAAPHAAVAQSGKAAAAGHWIALG
jgi:hypothetical protein